MSRLVVDLQDRRPIWQVPESVIERIRTAVPDDWDVGVVRSAVDGTADGAGRASEEALDMIPDAEVYLGFGVPPDIVRAGRSLRWIHTGTAGVGGSLTPALLERDIIFTNSAGIHAPPMAETVLAMALHFGRGIDVVRRAQTEARWDKSWFNAADSPVGELGRSTVGIVGLGGTGRAVATRMAALGARVLGLRRRGGEAPEGVELVRGDAGLRRILAESDYVVLAVPDTPETRGMIGRDALEAMKSDAVLINVARGSVVDEDALVSALRDGRIRGAGLDVFDAEPLPPDHPLWRLPNVLITPHVSAYSHHYWERETALIVENLDRYRSGRPLLKVVDKRAGY